MSTLNGGPNLIVKEGLTLYLDAGNRASYPGSGTTWRDLMEYKNNGTLINGPGFDSANGGSITYDGTDDNVFIPNSDSVGLAGDMTVLAWVNVTDFNWLPSIVAKTIANSFPAPYDYYLENNTGLPNFLRGNGTSIGGFTGTTGVSAGIWQYIGVTMIGTTCTHYLNGATNGSGTISAATANNPNFSMYVGNRVDGYTRMKGKYAILKLYNRGLSTTEILQNYNAQKSRFGL